MPWNHTLVSGAVRVSAVVLGGVAVAVLIGNRVPTANPPHGATLAASMAGRAARPIGEPSWQFTTDGWKIEVGEPHVDFPTLAEELAGRPRTIERVRLSPYDELVRHYSAKSGLDWRLITAVIYEESRFKPFVRSHMGAYGLMQVRQIAARAVGEEYFKEPADNIRTGVRYLRKLEKLFPEAHGPARLQLAIAAYNVGRGHVRDAQRLAREQGLDPNRWHGGIRDTLPLLEVRSIYRNLAHGFAQGSATVGYVDRVWKRYLDYKLQTGVGALHAPDPLSTSEMASRHKVPAPRS